MKNSFLKVFGLSAGLVFIASCDREEGAISAEAEVLIEEAQLTAEIDQELEAISDVSLQGFEDVENLNKTHSSRFLPDCATVSVESTAEMKTITIDFGNNGCTLENGNVVKGILEIAYDKNVEASSLVINYKLNDFYVNSKRYEGSRTITRIKENENGNPFYTKELNYTVTLEDGSSLTRIGKKTREWVEGVGNGNWGDNVFLVEGEWSTTLPSGNVSSTKVIQTLRREASCRFFVEGIIQLTRPNYEGALDFGEGDCDNLATFTNVDGSVRDIRL